MTAQSPGRPAVFSKHHHETQPQTYEEVLAGDSKAVPDVVRKEGIKDIGPWQIPTRWYLDRAVHELEKERIWKRTWQMVCRTDDIPSVGDTYIYNICGMSFLVVRSAPDSIKAFWNACLHRGLELRSCPGRVDRIQCPFHGFTWSLDGKCVLIPYSEEFPHLKQEEMGLPEVKVEVWEDFVFINPDPDAEPLEAYLGEFPGQFARWPFKGRHKAIHCAKVFNTNWKTLQEAFMESWHVLTVHPQFTVTIGERCAQFWASGNFARGIVSQGQSSDYLSRTPSEQEIMDRFCGVWDDEARPAQFVVPASKTARSAFAEQYREMMRPVLGAFVDSMCDAECVDVFYWTLFPNFHPFGGYRQPFVFRFLPFEDDHARSVMEVVFLMPVADGQEVPAPAQIQWLGEDEDFTAVKGLGAFGSFISQDITNMNCIMRGLRNNRRGVVNFARHQELKLRHFYALYEQRLGLSAAEEIAQRR